MTYIYFHKFHYTECFKIEGKANAVQQTIFALEIRVATRNTLFCEKDVASLILILTCIFVHNFNKNGDILTKISKELTLLYVKCNVIIGSGGNGHNPHPNSGKLHYFGIWLTWHYLHWLNECVFFVMSSHFSHQCKSVEIFVNKNPSSDWSGTPYDLLNKTIE